MLSPGSTNDSPRTDRHPVNHSAMGVHSISAASPATPGTSAAACARSCAAASCSARAGASGSMYESCDIDDDVLSGVLSLAGGSSSEEPREPSCGGSGRRASPGREDPD